MVSLFEICSLVLAALAAVFWPWPSLVNREPFKRATKKIACLDASAAVFATLAVLFQAIILYDWMVR